MRAGYFVTQAERPAGALAPAPAAAGPTLAYRAIEDIRVGDLVLSRAEGDAEGEFVAGRVDRTYARVSDHLRKLAVRDSTGALQEFGTTDEHPFWVEGLGWVDAGDIAPGQTLLQSDRGEARVEASEYDWHPSGVPVYNFRVEGLHTYFVAPPGPDGPAILVHNADYEPSGGGGKNGVGARPLRACPLYTPVRRVSRISPGQAKASRRRPRRFTP